MSNNLINLRLVEPGGFQLPNKIIHIVHLYHNGAAVSRSISCPIGGTTDRMPVLGSRDVTRIVGALGSLSL